MYIIYDGNEVCSHEAFVMLPTFSEIGFIQKLSDKSRTESKNIKIRNFSMHRKMQMLSKYKCYKVYCIVFIVNDRR